LLNIFSRHHRSCAFRKEQEHVKRLRLEFYKQAGLAELACSSIQLELAKPKVGREWGHK
jgi:hypothetical protein